MLEPLERALPEGSESISAGAALRGRRRAHGMSANGAERRDG
jgi:hypothetical protein